MYKTRLNKRIKFTAVKVKNRPVKVEFYTEKEGKLVWLKGSNTYEVTDPEELRTRDLIIWLRKNKFNGLAKILTTVIRKTK